MKKVIRLALISIFLLSCLSGVSTQPAHAATNRTVTNTNRYGAGSLSQAIFDSASGDTIDFDSTLAGETIAMDATSITKSITVDATSLSAPVTIDGGETSRFFQIASGITFELKNFVLTNGNYNGDGGAIYNRGTLKLTRVVISNSTAFGFGGAIENEGQLIVVDSTFSNNHSKAGDGGAIFNLGTVAVQNSTFDNNYPYAIYSDSTLSVTNSTFTGSGIAAIHTVGTLTLKNSTITNSSGFGIEAYSNYTTGQNTSTLSIENTILANNGDNPNTDCDNHGAIILAFIHNLVRRGNCGTPTSSADPKLGALADSGGPTRTMGLLPGSPAIDAGDDATCETVDQRGIARPQGAHCDIGAFEYVTPIVKSITRTDPSPTSAGSIRFTVTFSVPVTNVDSADFTLDNPTGGLPDTSIDNVTGSGDTYTITVNTGSGKGTLGLNVPVDASITDLAGDPLGGLPFMGGETYTIENPSTLFTFASMGDAHASDFFATTVNQVASLNPEFVIFNGDLENEGVDAPEMDPMIADLKNAGLYDQTFLVRGNHDDMVSGSAALWESYFETAPNIKNLPAGVTDYVSIDSSSDYLTYSYIYGNSMFVGLDVPGDADLLTTEELDWLDSRLTYAESQNLTHAFIYFHGPMYCVEETHCTCPTRTDGDCTPSDLVTVINRHPIISAFLQGHEHVLGWTHMDNTRLSELTGSFEEFITSPAGGMNYASYVFPDRMDYYYNTGEETQGFATISVNGASFTYSIYRDGTSTPVWSRTFTKEVPVTLLPTVTTQAVTDIAQITATGNGNITDLGIPNPTEHGVVWAITANPTTANSKTTEGSVSDTGAFTSTITGLTPNTLYHVRAYATNAAGTSYGEDVTFTTHLAPTYNLTVTKVGNGTVTPDKAAPYYLNDVVVLTPEADAGWTFSGWSGDCSGSGACSVTMDADKSVTATFTQNILTTGIYDDTNAAWAYTGDWQTYSGAGPYDNTLHFTGTRGDSAEVSFVGEQFQLTYTALVDRGNVDVYVDGVKVATITESGPGSWQQTWTSDPLVSGTHTVRLENASDGAIIDIDAIKVIGTANILTAGTYDEASGGVIFTTNWYTYAGAGPYTDSLHFSITRQETAQFSFTGEQFGLIYTQLSDRGKADVYVDGVKVVTLDESGPGAWQQTWTSDPLASGTHTVRMVDAGGGTVDLDGIKVMSSATIVGAGNYDDTDPGLIYSTDWYTYAGPGPDGDTLHFSITPGESVLVSFTGQQFKLTYTQMSDRGLVDVYVDGEKVGTIDESGPGAWQQTWTSDLLPAGNHSLRLVQASAGIMDIDALQIIATPTILSAGVHDDMDPAWYYSTYWFTYGGDGPYADTLHFSINVQDTALVAFSGTQFVLTYTEMGDRGDMDVYVDGSKAATINENGSGAWQKTWTSGVYAAGPHSVRLVHASGATVDVDAITVLP
jgi:uncharacterized repeat protein (TIGR02543 family)